MKPTAKVSDEYMAFQSFMHKVLEADPAEVRADIEAEQRTREAERSSQGQAKRGRKPKHASASGRASSEKD